VAQGRVALRDKMIKMLRIFLKYLLLGRQLIYYIRGISSRECNTI
jgi:hypothetical protein